jgi:hypothetical protein
MVDFSYLANTNWQNAPEKSTKPATEKHPKSAKSWGQNDPNFPPPPARRAILGARKTRRTDHQASYV